MKFPLPNFSQRTAKILVALFFIAFLLLGLLTTPDYGPPWDESTEQRILRMNAVEYARHLGIDWVLNSPTCKGLGSLLESEERDHGVAPLYPIASFIVDGNLNRHQYSMIWHSYCWLVFTLGAFALYSICRRLGLSRAISCFGVLMLLLSPRFFAEGHYNSKDVVFLSLVLVTLWQAIRFMQKPSFSAAICFALVSAFTCNVRFVGFGIWGACALFVLLYQIATKNLTRRVVLLGATTLGSLALFYVLLTPALWSIPAGEFFSYLFSNAIAFSRWDSRVLYLGNLYELKTNPLPWHYLPYQIFATTPMWILLLFLIGFVSLVVILCKKKLTVAQWLPLVLISLLWLLPLATAIATQTRTYNGWRHFFFLYGPILLTAIYGLAVLLKARAEWVRKAVVAVVAVICLLSGADMIKNHPHEYVYFQPFVRAALQEDGGTFIDTDYWHLSLREALTTLAEQTEEEEIPVGTLNMLWEANLHMNLAILPPELSARFRLVHYLDPGEIPKYRFITPTGEIVSGDYHTESMEEIFHVEGYGIPVMVVYEDLDAW